MPGQFSFKAVKKKDIETFTVWSTHEISAKIRFDDVPGLPAVA
jgi:hypothetical protein